MSDTKNIVIKVKYPTRQSQEAVAPKTITEWNYLRIAGALGALILLIGLTFWILGKNSENQTAPTIKADILSEPAKPENSTLASSAHPQETVKTEAPQTKELPKPTPANLAGRIRRANLAYRIAGKEPADLIGSEVKVNAGKPVSVYYFTEIRDKSGETLYHEWLHDGKVVLRHPLPIAAERWRATSQREFNPADLGVWKVRSVDTAGNLMNEISFTVSQK